MAMGLPEWIRCLHIKTIIRFCFWNFFYRELIALCAALANSRIRLIMTALNYAWR